MKAVAWDLRWKIALGLPVDHRGWHPTSLTRFRVRLLSHHKERLALENTPRLAEELGMLEGMGEQIIDSTPVLGAAATQDTVRLARHSVKKLLDAVAARSTATPPVSWIGRWSSTTKSLAQARLRVADQTDRERMLTAALRALGAVQQADGLLDAEAHRLPAELVGQDFELDEDNIPTLYRGHSRRLDRRRPGDAPRRKSSQTRPDGYKLSAAATDTRVPLICAVDVAAASTVRRPSSSSTPSRLLGARSGCSATPPADRPGARRTRRARCRGARAVPPGGAKTGSAAPLPG